MARNVRRTPQCHEEKIKKKKRKINHELKSHHKLLFSQHTPKANMVQLKTTVDAKNNIYKSGDKIFPRRSGEKVAASFGGDKKENRQTKPKHRLEVKTDVCATWMERQLGRDHASKSIFGAGRNEQKKSKSHKTIKASDRDGKNASLFDFPPLQHCFQKCNVSSVCVGNVAVRPPPPAPSSVIGRKER